MDEAFESLLGSNSDRDKMLAKLRDRKLLDQLVMIDSRLGSKFSEVHPFLIETIKWYAKFGSDGQYLVNGCLEFLDATKSDIDASKTSQEYLFIRFKDGGAGFIIEDYRLAEKLFLPEVIRNDHLFQEFEFGCILHVMMTNDVVFLVERV